jgi:parallel beta-helix repeat protein
MSKCRPFTAIDVGLSINISKMEIASRLTCLLVGILSLSIFGCAQLYCDEFSTYQWKDCNNNTWQENTSDGHISSPSLSSAPLENSGKSSICLDVSGPSMVSFWWKTDENKGNLGELSFWINDSKRYICDSSAWNYESYSLREKRNYTLKWEFFKFKSYPKNVGRGWIDDIAIIPMQIQVSPNFDKSEISIHQLDSNVTYVGQEDDPQSQTYSSINKAIQHVASGGTVIVPSGTYRENVVIDRPITLIGENRDKTFLASDNSVIYISENNVIVRGFTILGGGIGISAVGASDCIIEDNMISNNEFYGIYLEDCVNISVIKNNVSDVGDTGIHLPGSYGCTIDGNIVSDSSLISICIGGETDASFNNVIYNNTLIHSPDGIKIAPDSNWNKICDGTKRNYFINISSCDIYMPDCKKSMNSYPLNCTTDNGCKKCSI